MNPITEVRGVVTGTATSLLVQLLQSKNHWLRAIEKKIVKDEGRIEKVLQLLDCCRNYAEGIEEGELLLFGGIERK